MRRLPHGLLLLPSLIALGACGEESAGAGAASRTGSPLVLTTSNPLQYCTERIAGELATVRCVVPAGRDPLHWFPDRAIIAELQQADLIVRNGAGAEPWVFGASLPTSRVLDSSVAFRDRFVERGKAVTHAHGGGETHTHAKTVAQTWLDPKLLLEQSAAVLEALIELLPAEEPALRQGYRALAQDLEDLDARLRALGPTPTGTVLATAGDAIYGYPAERYGWKTLDLDLGPDTVPTGGNIALVRQALAGQGARYVVWPAMPNQALRERLAEDFQLESVVFAPCGSVPSPGEPDYLEAMRANVARLAGAFAPR